MCFPKPCSQEKASLMQSWRCSASTTVFTLNTYETGLSGSFLPRSRGGLGRETKRRLYWLIWSGVFELTSMLSSVSFVTVSESIKSHALSPFLVTLSSSTLRVTYLPWTWLRIFRNRHSICTHTNTHGWWHGMHTLCIIMHIRYM